MFEPIQLLIGQWCSPGWKHEFALWSMEVNTEKNSPL